jgi:hypothetical protein
MDKNISEFILRAKSIPLIRMLGKLLRTLMCGVRIRRDSNRTSSLREKSLTPLISWNSSLIKKGAKAP